MRTGMHHLEGDIAFALPMIFQYSLSMLTNLDLSMLNHPHSPTPQPQPPPEQHVGQMKNVMHIDLQTPSYGIVGSTLTKYFHYFIYHLFPGGKANYHVVWRKLSVLCNLQVGVK